MAKLLLHHHNDCPRCPIVGAEDIPSEEYYELLSLRFSLRIAQELSKTHESMSTLSIAFHPIRVTASW